jgi:hypothetical protein
MAAKLTTLAHFCVSLATNCRIGQVVGIGMPPSSADYPIFAPPKADKEQTPAGAMDLFVVPTIGFDPSWAKS